MLSMNASYARYAGHGIALGKTLDSLEAVVSSIHSTPKNGGLVHPSTLMAVSKPHISGEHGW